MRNRLWRSGPFSGRMLPRLAAPLAIIILGCAVSVLMLEPLAGLRKIGLFAAFIIAVWNPAALLTNIYPFFLAYSNEAIPFGPLYLSLERTIVILLITGVFAQFGLRRLELPKLPRALLFGALCLMLSLTPSLVYQVSEEAIKGYMSVAEKVLFFFLVLWFVDSESRLRAASRAMIVSYLFACLVGFILIILAGDLGVLREKSPYGPLQGFLFSFRTGYEFAVMGAIFCIIETAMASTSFQRGIWSLCSLLLLIGSTLSVRRQMPINILVALIHIAVLSRGFIRKVALRVLILVFGFSLGVLLYSPTWQARLSEPISLDKDSRLVLLRAGVSAWTDSPIIGTGIAGFPRAVFGITSMEHLSHIEEQGEPGTSHNTYVTFLVEAGVIGLAGLLGFLISVWLFLRDGSKKNLETYTELYCKFAPVIFVQVLIFCWFGEGHTLSSLWYVLGLCVASKQILKQQEQSQQELRN